jgi:hypothetical protein
MTLTINITIRFGMTGAPRAPAARQCCHTAFLGCVQRPWVFDVTSPSYRLLLVCLFVARWLVCSFVVRALQCVGWFVLLRQKFPRDACVKRKFLFSLSKFLSFWTQIFTWWKLKFLLSGNSDLLVHIPIATEQQHIVVDET